VATTANQLQRLAEAQPPQERLREINFAKRLKAIMAERDMSQSEVAAAIWGRSINAKGALAANGRDRLSVWVNGKNFPDRENLEKLAGALRVQVSELAPEAERRRKRRSAANWSITQPHGRDDVFLEVAQYVSQENAHAIQGILIKDAR
jgi:transcriptional regulator with XRE-family HTH domain